MEVFKVGNEIEVSGDVIHTLIKTIEMEYLRDKILSEYGFTNVEKGKFYSCSNYLRLLKTIHEKMPLSLRDFGRAIFSQAEWPKHIDTFEKAMMSIDIAFHMNHRKNGRLMYDPATGAMEEGIGHYLAEKTGSNAYRLTCDNVYPCPFDIEIIEGMAKSFKKNLSISHESSECRMKGALKCVYSIRVF